jgi:starvation-inducible DNA-binding protein
MNNIGLQEQKAKQLSENLNALLADYQILYMNVRGFHWNIKGDKFFELHAKFEELYDDLALKIDELAERILTLQSVPTHTFEDYIQLSNVSTAKNVSDGKDAIRHLLDAFKLILIKEREVLKLSDEADDEGTNALMSDYIREQEKLVWMYSAFLN